MCRLGGCGQSAMAFTIIKPPGSAGWEGDGQHCQDVDECAMHIDGELDSSMMNVAAGRMFCSTSCVVLINECAMHIEGELAGSVPHNVCCGSCPRLVSTPTSFFLDPETVLCPCSRSSAPTYRLRPAVRQHAGLLPLRVRKGLYPGKCIFGGSSAVISFTMWGACSVPQLAGPCGAAFNRMHLGGLPAQMRIPDTQPPCCACPASSVQHGGQGAPGMW